MDCQQEKKSRCILKDSGIQYEQNEKHRSYMEDFCKIHDNFNNGNVLLTLFDGHSGVDVAKEAIDTFPDIFIKSLEQVNKIKEEDEEDDDEDSQEEELKPYFPKPGTKAEKALQLAFKRLDDGLSKYDEVGATACVVYICKEGDKNILYSANVGDSRIVLVRKDKAERLTFDHKAIDKTEQKRVKLQGGMFYNNRLGGSLAITRSLGDFSLKKEGGFGLISVPFTKQTPIENDDTMVIVASDGIWDVINEEKLYGLIKEKESESASTLAETIVKTAVDLGSKDNISCIVAKLR